MMDSIWAVRCVWIRYFKVFQKNITYGIVTTLVEPLLYLFSFGFGLGSMIEQVEVGQNQLSYKAYVFSGILAQTVLFQGFFEAAYGSFIRMYYQKIFKAMALTPVTISEVLIGELLWDASRATFSSIWVLTIGVYMQFFSPMGAILVLPLCFLFSLLFASLGLLVSAKSKSIEQLSYPQYLLVIPMFLFCGVFFPIEHFPVFLQFAAWALPLTPVLSIIRGLLLDITVPFYAWILSFIWLVFLFVASRRAMKSRIVM